MRSARLRFLVLFFLLLVAFEVPLLLEPVDRTVIRPFTTGVAAVSGSVLNALAQPVTVAGTAISGSCFSVNINNGCNGVEASLFLVAAVLAFPASAGWRLLGGFSGLLLIQAVNLIRVVSLYMVGCYRRAWFDAFHLAIWQTVVFGVAVLYFLWWTRRSAPPDAAERA